MIELRKIRASVPLKISDMDLEDPDMATKVTLFNEHQIEDTGHNFDDVGIRELLNDVMDKYSPGDTKIDKAVCVKLHGLLPISRKIAADKGMWTWLASVFAPGFVCHRWKPYKGKKYTAARFLGDPVRNALARLWWAAELTVDENKDYSITEQLLSMTTFQDCYEALFGRSFSRHRAALRTFIEVMQEEHQDTIREASRRFNFLLSTLVLEVLDENDIRHEVKLIIDELKGKLTLANGSFDSA